MCIDHSCHNKEESRYRPTSTVHSSIPIHNVSRAHLQTSHIERLQRGATPGARMLLLDRGSSTARQSLWVVKGTDKGKFNVRLGELG